MKYCPICRTKLLVSENEGIKRLSCSSESCNYVFWNNPTPVVVGIVEMDNQVILVRNRGWPEDMFGLVTGFLEKGESPDDAILREVKEELDLDGDKPDFIGYYSFFELNQLLLAFHMKAQGKIVLNDELADYKLIPVDKLKAWDFGSGPAVRDWLKRRGAESAG